MKIELQLLPFNVPNCAIVKTSPTARQEGFIESPKFHLRDLEPDVLSELCDEFRRNVFAKAEKNDPAMKEI